MSDQEPVVDNLEASMDAVASSLVPTRGKTTGAPKGEQAQSQILIRATSEDHELIKSAASAHRSVNVGVCSDNSS